GWIIGERYKDTDDVHARSHTRVSAASLSPSACGARFLAKQVGLVDNTDKRDRSMAEARARSADAQAPWAEIVPHTGLMTEEELLALPEDGWQYELVEGRLVRMPPSGLRATQVAFIIGAALFAFAQPRKLGVVTGADGGYKLGPGSDLAPDVGFVRADRLPPRNSPDYDRLVSGAPDLAVEVASPTQRRPALRRKAQRYLAAGTRLVWIVWPKHQQIEVWRPGDTRPSATLGVADTLDGDDVLPGFTYPVSDIFA
ncbi:MAG TPA: Uma2 family endonuclease, partial [Chloroflexota bacterium]|nr:Uma2 family endonuclease [Chloroflexota bacterium]